MTVIADLEEEQLKQHLIVGGFLTAFTDIFGVPKPAPFVQILEFDLTKTSYGPKESDNIVMIRTVGNVSNPATNTLFTQRNMLIAVVGDTSAKGSAVAKGLAMDMETWLK